VEHVVHRFMAVLAHDSFTLEKKRKVNPVIKLSVSSPSQLRHYN
jgi:hypothetical protein